MNPRNFPGSFHPVYLVLLLALAGACASTPRGEPVRTAANAFDPSAQVQSATNVVRSYESSLNAGDVDAIVAIYAEDGVLMAPHRSPVVGREQVEAAYRQTLGMIRLELEFEIDEVVVVSPTLAYARTRSTGTLTVLANDASNHEENQELFLLTRANASSEWRIGRYIFSSTQANE